MLANRKITILLEEQSWQNIETEDETSCHDFSGREKDRKRWNFPHDLSFTRQHCKNRSRTYPWLRSNHHEKNIVLSLLNPYNDVFFPYLYSYSYHMVWFALANGTIFLDNPGMCWPSDVCRCSKPCAMQTFTSSGSRRMAKAAPLGCRRLGGGRWEKSIGKP